MHCLVKNNDLDFSSFLAFRLFVMQYVFFFAVVPECFALRILTVVFILANFQQGIVLKQLAHWFYDYNYSNRHGSSFINLQKTKQFFLCVGVEFLYFYCI